MKKILHYIQMLIVVYIALDISTFFMWALSGQVPQDGFYFGALTKFIIHLFI